MDQNVETLVEKLWDREPQVRAESMAELVRLGEKAVNPLLDALENDDRSESAFEYENRLLRRTLIQIGEPALLGIIEALRSGRLGRAAVKVLMLFKDVRITEPLLEVVRDADHPVNTRAYALDALAYLQPPEAFDSLVSLLEDSNLLIRGHAARALGNYRDPRTLPAIRKSLQHPGTTPFMDWRKSAETALRRIEEPTFRGSDPGFFEQYLPFMAGKKQRPGLSGSGRVGNGHADE